MARRTTPPMPENKRIMSVWSWIWLLLVAFIILSVVLQKCGIQVLKQSEDTELLDKPHR